MTDKSTPRATHSRWPVSRSQLRTIFFVLALVVSLPAMSLAGGFDTGTANAASTSTDISPSLATTSASSASLTTVATEDNTSYYDDFEDGTADNWTATGSGTAWEVSTDSFYGTNSLYLNDSDMDEGPRLGWTGGPTFDTGSNFEISGTYKANIPSGGTADRVTFGIRNTSVPYGESEKRDRTLIRVDRGYNATDLATHYSDGLAEKHIDGISNNEWMNFRLQMDNGDAKLKVWAAGTDEPEQWEAERGFDTFDGQFYMSAGANNSGRELWLDEIDAGGNAISGQVVDQNGDPVPNATVGGIGVNSGAINDSVEDKQAEAEKLLNDAESVELPEEWQTFEDNYGSNGLLDTNSFTSDVDGTYPLVHQSNDWNQGGTDILSEEVDDPRLQVDSEREIVISLWDLEEENRFLPEGPVDNSHPGAVTEGTVVLEQFGPGEGVVETETIGTKAEYEVKQPLRAPTDYHAIKRDLSPGVYRVYPEGSPEKAYTFQVGDAESQWTALETQLQNEAGELTDRAKALQSNIDSGLFERRTTTTDENGYYTLRMQTGVQRASIQAYRADGTILPAITGPSFQDLRNAAAGDYNGTYHVGPPGTYDVPQENVTLETIRTDQLPYQGINSLNEFRDWVRSQRLNETIAELESDYDERFDEMERERLENVYNSTVPMVETLPGAEDRYLNQSEFEAIQDESDLTNDELATETGLMREALIGVDRLEPPTFEDGDPGTIAEGLFNAEYPLPAGVDEETVTPELHYPNGTSEEIDEEYWSIESGGVFGTGSQTLVVSDVPIPENTAGVELRVQGVGDGARLDDRISARNPSFSGSIPQINAVDFSTVAPGPSEQVSVGINPADNTGYEGLVSAEAWNDDGDTLPTTVDSSRDRASFTTDGQGVHTVRLTYETQQGDRFVLTEKIDAKQQSRSDPATIRAAGDPQSLRGIYAVTGEELDGARLESKDGTLSVAALAEDSDGPSELTIQPSNAMAGSEHTIDVDVLHGSAEERVSGNIPVNIHIENPEETTIYWRSSAGIGGDPITHSGDTRFGSVEKPNDEKHVVRTYTEPDGSLTVTTIKAAGFIERSTHRVAKSIGGIPFVGSIAVPTDVPTGVGSGGFVSALGLAGIAVHRRRTQP